MNNASAVEDLLFAALEKSNEAERAAFLDSACGGDVELRGRVEKLLKAHADVGDFLQKPAVEQLVVAQESSAATQALDPSNDPKGDVMTRTVGEAASDDNSDLGFLQPSTRPDSLGRLGHYEVLQVLGRGGFGIVFRAFDEMLQRVVALKVMAPTLAATSPARKRFLREARCSAQVRHENVVQVYEVAEEPLPYLVMEFIPGETLQQKLDRVGPLDVPEVVHIGRQIAEGLAAAHATDMIHRDIKPGNVLLEGGSHKAKITDFGLARAADDASLSQSGIIAGTPMYMAPEQAEGHTLDQRADLFSLGSVLYQMVAGRPPFRANTTVAVLKRVAEDKPRAIREIIPETPQWLCDIIAKLHAKNPDDRYQSARAVADVLADCEAQLKANAKLKDYSRIPQSQPQRSGRGKWAAAAAAVVLLPVIALLVTEFAGVTHLFRGQQATHDPIKPGTWPAPIQVVKQELPPLAVAPFGPAKAKEHQEAWAKHLGVESEITNSIGMKLRLIPPGKFFMGSRESETDWGATERPQHEVTISKPFRLGSHAVTVGQFKVFAKEKEYKTEAELGAGALRIDGNRFLKDPATNWLNPGFKQSDEHPVLCITWNDAKAFCNWLSEKEKTNYVLPGEAQWEYACRAGSKTRFFFGDDDGELANYAWHRGNAENRTHPVGLLKPNAWGLYDMHGNVFQWAQDLIGEYPNGAVTDPTGPRNGSERVTRGGSFADEAKGCRSAVRGYVLPHDGVTHLGFRVALVGDLKSPPVKPEPLPPRFTNTIGDRRAAENVLSIGGIVCIDGNERVIQAKGDLPTGTFRLTYVGLNHNKQVTDAGLAAFESCTNVIHLELVGTPVTDAGLAHFKNCKGLTVVALAGVKVDAGLAAFKNSNLTDVNLENTPVTDAGLAHLKDCKNLKSISLLNTRVTDAGLAHLKDCKALAGLDLRIHVTDEGLAHFKDCKNLKQLSVWGAVTNEGLAVVKEWPNLELLRLVSNNVSDAGLDPVKRCKNLKLLEVRGTKVSAAGIETLAKALPQCKIEWDGGVIEPTVDSDRRAAEYVLSIGGTVRINGITRGYGKVAELPQEPFRLTEVHLVRNPHVTDAGLAVFKDCTNVVLIDLHDAQATDTGLAHFKNCKGLTALRLENVPMTDAALAMFKNLNLTHLNLASTQVTDNGLLYLKDCKNLEHFDVHNTKVSDTGLARMKRMSLRKLLIDDTRITDLTPLQDIPLEYICLTPKNITKGLDILREMKSLKTIGIHWQQALPAAEFWERYDKGEFGKAAAPFTDADVKRIAALPAAEQVEEVRKELMRRNPGFDGKITPKTEGDVVTEFRIVTDQVTDIAPIRVWSALRAIDCSGTYSGKPNGVLADLTPLKGMNLANLTRLRLDNTPVGDEGLGHFENCKNLASLSLVRTRVSDAGLGHFKDCKALTHLILSETKVSDVGLAHFKNCKNLLHLGLHRTQVGDTGLAHFKECKFNSVQLSNTRVSVAGLAHLKGMRPRVLTIHGTDITDLTPLQGMPLEEIRLTPKYISKGLDILRDMKSLKTIGTDFNQAWPAAEFWQRYDKGEFGKAGDNSDANRRAAEYLLANGGFVKVNGQDKEIKAAADLPGEAFRLKGVILWNADGNQVTVTEAGLAVFKDCKDVTEIKTFSTRLTNAGLAHFKNCKDLTFIGMESPGAVTDEGLAAFKDCKNLKFLRLTGVPLTGAGLVHFKDCKNLASVHLYGTKVSDAGLSHLKDCKKLTDLSLLGTQVGDAGLAHLAGLTALTELDIRETKVTATGVEDLARALPKCRIHRDGGVVEPLR